MKQIISLTLVLAIISTVFSQNNKQELDEIKKNIEYKNRVYIAPLNMLDPINPFISLGFERHINNKHSIQLEAGYITKRSLWGYIIVDLMDYSDAYLFTNEGYHLNAEYKYYFSKNENIRVNSYISGGINYTFNNSNVWDTYISSKDEIAPIGEKYDDFYDIDKIKAGVSVKYGITVDMFNNFVLDCYIGFGLVYRNIKHNNRLNKNDLPYDEVRSLLNKEGSIIMPNTPINIKFGYRF
jgi:hypothetical protein